MILILLHLVIASTLAGATLEKSNTFIILGDWGKQGNDQSRISTSITKTIRDPSFIISLGDNFYKKQFYSDGIQKFNSPRFKTDWKDVYKKLTEIPWYNTFGNHDWYNSINAQISHHRLNKNWNSGLFYKLNAFENLAILFIDTNLLEYGYSGDLGEKDVPDYRMKKEFEKLGWIESSNAIQLHYSIIEKLLQSCIESKYVIVVGHHPILSDFSASSNLQVLQELFVKYKVSAYFFGHKHFQSFRLRDGIAHVQTGAASKDSKHCRNEYDDGIWIDCGFGFATGDFGDGLDASFMMFMGMSCGNLRSMAGLDD